MVHTETQSSTSKEFPSKIVAVIFNALSHSLVVYNNTLQSVVYQAQPTT